MVDDARRKGEARRWRDFFGGSYRDAHRATSWPSAMHLTVAQPHHLLLLLYIRSAWELETETRLPLLMPQPERGSSARPAGSDPAALVQQWEVAWRRGWEWMLLPRTMPTREDILAATRPGAALMPGYPPTWTAEHGDVGIDQDAFSAWQVSVLFVPQVSLAASPDRRSAPEVAVAWRSGLSGIVELPFAEPWSSVVGTSTLGVSTVTREDPREYQRALRAFVETVDGGRR
jgi:hypothetical protein